MATIGEELTRLAALRDQGILTDAEFETQKAALLGSGPKSEDTTKAEAKVKAQAAGVAASKGCLVIVALAIGLFVLVAIFGGNTTSSPATSAASAVPPQAVTATELFDAYQNNEAAAQTTYGDRPLMVSGVVDGVDLDFSDEPVVKLRTSNQFLSAQASLTDASQARAGSLSKGQKVVLLCTGVGEVIGAPMLKECELQ